MRTIHVGAEMARALGRRMPSLASLDPRPDGTHLTTLFAHLRDLEILEAGDCSRPARTGPAYLTPDERHETFIAWAADPAGYARLWSLCAATIDRDRGLEVHSCATRDQLPAVLAGISDRSPAPPVPATRALSRGVWCDYADIADGRVHLRRAGAADARPLLVFQSAPGSTAPLCGLIEGLADHHVIAADYLGNGDSAKPVRKVDIALLARDALRLADRLGLDRFDLWGTHTGALVALELALLAPERVSRAVLEAPPLLPADFSQDILANYLPTLVPDKWGLHVQQAWNMRRDMFLFWPWYRQQRDAVRPLGLPDDVTLHDWTVGLLKSGRTYDLSYRAAFEYPTAQRLPRLARPALICAGPADMLADGLARAREIAPRQVQVLSTPATVWYPNQSHGSIGETIAIYRTFLAGHEA
jgi:pimeloyl-ACP methyl ester carboxylesterase